MYIDLTSKDNSDFTVFIGGEFNLSKSLQLRFGSSTKKFQQNIEKDLFSSFAGASGFGFGYETKEININCSSEMIEMDINLNKLDTYAITFLYDNTFVYSYISKIIILNKQ